MNEETFNISIRKFLMIALATVTLEVPGVKLIVKFDGEIKLE